jgi:sodium/proline symporter
MVTAVLVATFILYALILVVLGIKGFKRIASSDDYVLGSRSIGWFVSALSAEAADISAWLFMGLPATIFACGLGYAWIAVGLLIGTAINWIFIAKRLRQVSGDYQDSVTIPSFLAAKFTSHSRSLRITSGTIIAFFFTIYTASGFIAGGKLFSHIFGIPYLSALLIMATIILTYTFLGGFFAISWTAVLQGLLIILAVVIVPSVVIGQNGGLDQLGSNLPEHFLNPFYSSSEPISAVEVISGLAWGLGYFGLPHVIIKFMAMRNDENTRKSGIVAILWVGISLGFAVGVGIVGRAFYASEFATEGADTENIFIEMIQSVFIANSNLVTVVVAGFLICAILSAVMSTAAAQLLMSASIVVQDFWEHILGRKSQHTVLIMRTTVLGIAALGFVIALNPNSSIMVLVSDAWAGLGAAFSPLIILLLYWKRTTGQGALCGIISGAAVVIIWDFVPLIGGQTLAELTKLYSLTVGFAVSTLVIVIVSALSCFRNS